MSKKKIIIVGAGIAGLSLAYELLLRGHDVLIVEKDSFIGGLSKSVRHNDCYLDIGVHIMYLKDGEVGRKVREIVGPHKLLKIKRNGKLYLKKRYVDWPLTYRAVYQLPITFILRILRDQLIKRGRRAGEEPNFKEELLNIYGPALYYSFFDPLTRKFLKADPEEIHPDWAFSSIRSATKIEDKSFRQSHKYLPRETDSASKREFNVVKFLAESLGRSREDEEFYYFTDGFGTLTEAYGDKILSLGGRILTNSSLRSFVFEDGCLKKCVIDGDIYDADSLVWSAGLYDLCWLLKIDSSALSFLYSKYVYLFLKKCNKHHQVCYYADKDISFVRGTILSNHSKAIIRNKEVSDILCLEYSFSSMEEMRKEKADTEKITGELKRVGMIDDGSDIESVYEINAPFTYPLLTKDYKENLERIKSEISGYRNITLFGRQATFGYDNADIIIKEAIRHPLLGC